MDWSQVALQPDSFNLACRQASLTSKKGSIEEDPSAICELLWAFLFHKYTGSDCIAYNFYDDRNGATKSLGFDFQGAAAQQEPFLAFCRTGRQVRSSSKSDGLKYAIRHQEKKRNGNINDTFENCLAVDGGQHEFILEIRGSFAALDRVSLWFRETCVSRRYAEILASALDSSARSLFEDPGMILSDINLLSPKHISDLRRWNAPRARPHFISLVAMLREQAKKRPQAPAIHAWDGELTYEETEGWVSSIMSYLVFLGVGHSDHVILRMEKSKWAIVGMIATLAAGAVCVPVDIRHPSKQIEHALRTTGAKFLLVDHDVGNFFAMGQEDHAVKFIPLPPPDSLSANLSPVRFPPISPNQAALVYFTSGSTGVPKGVVQEHYAVSITVQEIARSERRDENTRTMQYSSFCFDPCVGDIFGTIHAGGCICIPSEAQRLDDLASAIRDTRSTHLCVTATTLSALSPLDVPCLQQVSVGGEAMTQEQVQVWAPRVRLSLLFGTTESVIWDTRRDHLMPEDTASNIGYSMGPSTWIVDQHEPSKLNPIGVIGELLLGGSSLARGYLADSRRTDESFVSGLPWLKWFPGCAGEERCYRTGDLAQYNSDGSIQLIGRKDRQVKINGQRVELGEIEAALSKSLPSNIGFAVDLVKQPSKGNESALLAFLSGPEDTVRLLCSRSMRLEMSKHLPDYMLPSAFIPVGKKLPLTPSGKIDRRRLQKFACESSNGAVVDVIEHHDPAANNTAVDSAYSRLKNMWTEILKLKDCEHVDGASNFFQMGGTSIHAIRLVALCRKQGLHLTVRKIFEHPKLSSQASIAKSTSIFEEDEATSTTKSSPFTLLKTSRSQDDVRRLIAVACNVSENRIEDAYPCTPLQAGLIADTAKDDENYVVQVVIRLPQCLDLIKFKDAYATVCAETPILRTRFVSVPSVNAKILQVSMKEEDNLQWHSYSDLAHCKTDSRRQLKCGLGEPLVRCNFVNDRVSKGKFFVWTIHHALHDGWSMTLILRALERTYLGLETIPLLSFDRFCRYLQTTSDEESSKAFWKSELHGADFTLFPRISSFPERKRGPCRFLTSGLCGGPWFSSSFTPTTIARAAWAILLSCYANTKSVTYGVTVSGRQAALSGVEKIAGPTIATVPIHISLQNFIKKPVIELLNRIQWQAIDMIPFEHFGLSAISRLSSDANQACKFHTLLIVQGMKPDGEEFSLLQPEDEESWDIVNTYPIILEFTVREDTVSFRLQYEETTLSGPQANRLLQQLDHIVRQLCAATKNQSCLLSDLDLCSPRDKQDMQDWNTSRSARDDQESRPNLDLVRIDPSMRKWIVDPENHDRLLPIGAIGRLLLEQPPGSRTNVHEENRWETSCLIDSPAWFSVSNLNDPDSKFYKTADLAMYAENGFIYRCNQQDHLPDPNGYQDPFNEIELHICNVLNLQKGNAIIEIIPDAESARDSLCAFLLEESQNEEIRNVSEERTSYLKSRLADFLPSQLIPNRYITMKRFSKSPNKDIDRHMLRAMAVAVPQSHRHSCTNGTLTPKQEQLTRTQKILGNLWAVIFGDSRSTFDPSDHFIRLGGNSIDAMRLVAEARKEGFSLSVPDVMMYPSFGDQAQKLIKIQSEPERHGCCSINAFSLLGNDTDVAEICTAVAAQCGVHPKQIEDVFPCTPTQSALLSSTAKSPGDYVMREIYRVSVDSKRFQRAWQAVAAAAPILRTRIVDLGKRGLFQAILSENLSFEIVDCPLIDHLRLSELIPMEIGTALTHLALVSVLEKSDTFDFVWTMHHALYDSVCYRLLLDSVECVYEDKPIPELTPFTQFIQYGEAQVADAQAETFWKDRLKGATRTAYPCLPLSSSPLAPTREGRRRYSRYSHVFSHIERRNAPQTLSTIAHAAWSILLGQYCGSDDVVFGSVTSGRQAPIPGIQHVVGPTIATVPFRVQLKQQMSIWAFLESTNAQALQTVPYEQLALRDIRKINRNTEQACQFETILVIQPEEQSETDLFNDFVGDRSWGSFNDKALLISCELKQANIEIVACYDQTLIDTEQVSRMISQLQHVVEQICMSSVDTLLSDLDLLSPSDSRTIWDWNLTVPTSIENTVDNVFERVVAANLDSQAVCAADENFTYHELNSYSNLITRKLSENGLKLRDHIPLLFEKSAWAVVATLAAIKQGGCVILLEPTQPTDRLKKVIGQINPSVIMASEKYQDLAQKLLPGGTILVVGSKIKSIDLGALTCTEVPRPLKSPRDPLYITFTSGSTSNPKGVVITHGNACSFVHNITGFVPHSPGARVLDASSYAFDATWANLLCALCSGACLCLPKDAKDFAADALTLQPTILFSPPSVVRQLDLEDFPSLQTLILGGEVVRHEDYRKWEEQVKVIHAYGPSECTPYVSFANLNDAKKIHLGRGPGAVMWIVDLANKERLAPIGCVGELWLEGPQVGPGYYHMQELTDAVFIDDPTWFKRMPGNSRKGRFYNTGDLVQYNSDGTLRYLGRRDTQIKLSGQRIELTEVENAIQRCVADTTRVVAEVARLPSTEREILIVFLCETAQRRDLNDSWDTQSIALDFRRSIETEISKSLPVYMQPSAYLQLRELPLLVSGKTDRAKLRNIAAETITADLRDLSLDRSQIPHPVSTLEEQKLQDLWANALGVAKECVGANDSFFQTHGGDSISAMRLSSLARRSGIPLTVAEIFSHPRLNEMASKLGKTSHGAPQTNGSLCTPFHDAPQANGSLSSAEPALSNKDIKTQAAVKLNVSVEVIEDMFPCTPLQEGLLSLTSKSPNAYVRTKNLVLRQNVDLDRFWLAWDRVFNNVSILRTRMIDLPGAGIYQVVLNTPFFWDSTEDDEPLEVDTRFDETFGKPLTKWKMIRSSDNRNTIVWTIHHALYDGFSAPLVLEQVTRAYHQEQLLPLQSMREFISFLSDVDEESSERFWTAQLRDCIPPSFPTLPSAAYRPIATEQIEVMVSINQWPRGVEATASSWIRAAWAVVLGGLSAANDVTFGAAVSGRSVPVKNIEYVVGPIMATIPMRIKWESSQCIGEVVRGIHANSVEMLSFEHVGIQKLKRLNMDTKQACSFQNLLNIHKAPVETDHSLWHEATDSINDGFDVYAWNLDVELHDQSVVLRVDFDPKVISREQAERVIHQFHTVIAQFTDRSFDGRTPMSHIQSISSSDVEQIWKWNATVPQAFRLLLDDVIAERFVQHPQKCAVNAWDGDLTFGELDRLSTHVASHLQDQENFRHGVIVPLLFEKSRWIVVAIMGVMKAGGVFTLLDPTFPKERLLTITRQIDNDLILTSQACLALASKLSQHKIVVGPSAMCLGPNPHPLKSSDRRPEDKLYLIFTSGSTGLPKGAIITHVNFCSAVKHQQIALQYSKDTRVLDFASYGFDIAISNLLHSLASGGCLCIPSETERKSDLSQVITDYRVNLIDLTPSVSRVIDPTTVPSLKTLVLGGETATREDVVRWASSHVQVLNGIGQAECTVTTTMARVKLDGPGSHSLGKGAGANTWIVNHEDHNQLLAIGLVGELLVEGPIVGEGYLLDKKKTCAAFIKDPPWLTRGSSDALVSGRSGRLYKTGDLVRYADDGSLLFVGRKDAQTKIRGQRIELEEVEHHVRKLLTTSVSASVVAEVVKPSGASNPILVVFISARGLTLGSDEKADECCIESFDLLPNAIQNLNERLSESVMSAMIPFAYIPINHIPFSPNGKVDRKRLRSLGSSLSLEKLTRQTLNPKTIQQASLTATEKHLRRLWSQTLDRKEEHIDAKNNFMQLGGDSILAMRLVGLAKEQGLRFSVEDVFKHSRLDEMARIAQSLPHGPGAPGSQTAFSMLPTSDVSSFLSKVVLPYSNSTVEAVEDAFPVTDFQERCIRATLSKPSAFLNYFFLDLDKDVDVQRLEDACQSLPKHLPILRTIFVPFKDSFLQVIMKSLKLDVQIFEIGEENLSSAAESICRADLRSSELVAGATFTALIRVTSKEQRKSRLIIRLSHAHYDGLSLDPMMETLGAIYRRSSVPPNALPLTPFIKYKRDHRDAGLRYWSSLLSDSSMRRIAVNGSASADDSAGPATHRSSFELEAKVSWNIDLPNGITAASALTACWAAALATHLQQKDVVFGRLVSGRALDAEINLEHIVGPCLNIVPIRAQWPHGQHHHHCSSPRRSSLQVREIFANIQRQHIEAIPHESVSLRDIIRHCTGWHPDTDFDSVFQYRSFPEMPRVQLDDSKALSLDVIKLEFSPKQLWVVVEPQAQGKGMKIQMFGSEEMSSRKVAEELLDLFSRIVREVSD